MADTRKPKPKLVIGVESLPGLTGDLSLAASPLAFLNEALEKTYSGLVIVFRFRSLKQRRALAELCGFARSNPLSRDKPMLCVLQETHRRLVEQLAKSGVEWTVCLDREGLPLAEVLLNPERFQTAEYATSRLLSSLCPFLHYQPVDHRRELKVCGAYRDRMVLGPPRLKSFCHQSDHHTCPFYLAPHFHQERPTPAFRESYNAL